MENEINPGIEGTGAQTDPGTEPNSEAEAGAALNNPPAQEQSKPERMFTREQVNQIMKRRVERSHNAMFTRYGVKDLNELDNLFGQSKSYGPLKEKFDELDKNHSDLMTSYKDLQKRYAFRVGNIDEQRVADIETYFKGKNIEIDENTLAQELKTHPEWIKKVGKVQPIGAEATPPIEMDERALAAKYLNANLTRKR